MNTDFHHPPAYCKKLAHRNRPFLRLNATIARLLQQAGLLENSTMGSDQPEPVHGLPILITSNDYQLELFNGDIGIFWRDPANRVQAFFIRADGTEASFSPARLPAHEAAFAMTVHKSQGSEFKRVLFILPPSENPVVTRELLYTGITRASKQVEIWFKPVVVRAAVNTPTIRYSGLSAGLERNDLGTLRL